MNLDDRESNMFLTVDVLTVNVQMLHKRDTAAKAQLGRALARKRKVRCSNPSSDRPTS